MFNLKDYVSNKLNNVEIDATHPLPAYLNYSVTYDDGVAIAPNHLLAANSSETYRVSLKYKDDLDESQLPTTDKTIVMKQSNSLVMIIS